MKGKQFAALPCRVISGKRAAQRAKAKRLPRTISEFSEAHFR